MSHFGFNLFASILCAHESVTNNNRHLLLSIESLNGSGISTLSTLSIIRYSSQATNLLFNGEFHFQCFTVKSFFIVRFLSVFIA